MSSNEPEHLCKLFIGGLDYRTSDESLKAHFEQYGEIVDVIVMKDPQTKRSRGFGFVAFSQSYMVDDAQKNRPHEIDGRTVDTKRAIPRDEIGRSEGGGTGQVKKLFIGGIKDATEDDIRDCFSQFGEVVNVSIPIERETQKKRGFAFVEFADSDAADKAALQRELMILDNRVDVKKARDKSERGGSGGGGGGRGGSGGGRGGGGWGGGGGGGGGGRDSYSQGSGSWGGSQGGYGSGASTYGSSQGGYGGSSSYGQSGQAWGGQQTSSSQWGGYGGADSSSSGGSAAAAAGGSSSSWGGQQADFGNNYSQSYSGGPTRGQGGYQNSRSTPYGGGSQSYGMSSGGSTGGSTGGYGGGSAGYGNKRY